MSHPTSALLGILTLLMKHSHLYVARTITPASHWRRENRPRTGDEVLLVWRERERWQDGGEAGEDVGSIDSGRPQPTQTRARSEQEKPLFPSKRKNKKLEGKRSS